MCMHHLNNNNNHNNNINNNNNNDNDNDNNKKKTCQGPGPVQIFSVLFCGHSFPYDLYGKLPSCVSCFDNLA